MKNLKDEKTKIYPSTTRGGKELPSSSALDSPSVISKLATPKPATVMNSDMSHVINDATSALHDTTMPLGEFLDEQLARARENEIIEDRMMKVLPLSMNCLLFLRVMLWMKKLLELFFLAMINLILRSY